MSGDFAKLCPHCGHDLALDEVERFGDLVIPPYGAVVWHGRKIEMTAAEKAIIFSLAKAGGRLVTNVALRERLDTEAGDNIIKVYVCRIRRRFAAIGKIAPIETVWGRGYRWDWSEAA